MRRHFSRMHKVKGALGRDPFFSDMIYIFHFLLAFYIRILILYTTDFNSRINKDIIIIIIIIIIITLRYLAEGCSQKGHIFISPDNLLQFLRGAIGVSFNKQVKRLCIASAIHNFNSDCYNGFSNVILMKVIPIFPT